VSPANVGGVSGRYTGNATVYVLVQQYKLYKKAALSVAGKGCFFVEEKECRLMPGSSGQKRSVFQN
jgi:hypothetical protein